MPNEVSIAPNLVFIIFVELSKFAIIVPNEVSMLFLKLVKAVPPIFTLMSIEATFRF